MTQLTCFKAYDIRGKLGTELNEEIAYREWERQCPPGNPMMTSEQCEFERQENGMILLRCDLTHISLRP